MSHLTASEQSLKSLAFLDTLVLNNPDKATEIITSTKGEPLIRLTLAAISRLKKPVYGFSPDPETLSDQDKVKKFVDMLINDNLLFDGENLVESVEILGKSENPGGLQRIFTELLVRFLLEQD